MSSYLIKRKIFHVVAPSIFLFLLIYIVRFVMVFQFDNWFLIWFRLEINILRFILIIFKHKNISTLESCFKYFFIQRIGSRILIFVWYFHRYMIDSITRVVLRLKLGAAPFYYWFPRLIDGIDWFRAFLLIRVQKIIPLFIMRMFNRVMIWFILILRLLVGGFGMFNQSKLKLIIAYSSIHHLGWLIFVIKVKIDYWFIYLVMYSILIYPLIVWFNKIKILSLMEVGNIRKIDLMILGIIRLSGLPPFLGFYLKMWVFLYLIDFSLYLFVYIFIMSVLICYIYIRIVYLILMVRNEGSLMFYRDVDYINLRLIGYLIGSVFGFYIIIL